MTQVQTRAGIALSLNLMTAVFVTMLLTWPESTEPSSAAYAAALLVAFVLLLRGRS